MLRFAELERWLLPAAPPRTPSPERVLQIDAPTRVLWINAAAEQGGYQTLESLT